MPSDQEVAGERNSYDFGARMYDPRVGRFFSVDPMARLDVGVSRYSYAGNSPILFVDLGGLFKFPTGSDYEKKYPRLTNYIKDGIQSIASNPTILAALSKFSEQSPDQIKNALEYGQGPTIIVTDNFRTSTPKLGEFTPFQGNDWFKIADTDLVQKLENATGDERDVYTVMVGITVLHEYAHYGDDQDGRDIPGEEGTQFEKAAYGQDFTHDYNGIVRLMNDYNERNGIEKRYEQKPLKVELREFEITAPAKK
jgi:RHS repeat-associated protein